MLHYTGIISLRAEDGQRKLEKVQPLRMTAFGHKQGMPGKIPVYARDGRDRVGMYIFSKPGAGWIVFWNVSYII